MDSVDNDIYAVAKEIGFTKPLKDGQLECLRCVIKRQDLMAILPTGYGKSLIYQVAPFLIKRKFCLDKSVCLVITPLNSIMMDQINSMHKQGVRACWLDYQCQGGQAISEDVDEDSEDTNQDPIVSVPVPDIAEGKYSLVYAHPEALLSTTKGRSLLTTMEKNGILSCIAVDEAHMILEWYKKNSLITVNLVLAVTSTF